MKPITRTILAVAMLMAASITVSVLHAETPRLGHFTAAAQQLPDGPGKEVVSKLCAGCHDLMFTVSTRETEDGWRSIVNDMRSKGADGPDADFEKAIAYLAAHMGKGPAVQTPTATPVVPRVQVQPDTLKWSQAGPGIQTAIVLGDPTKPGIYVQRLKFAKGTRVAPHMHPDERVAVVLSGSMYFGYGEAFDEAALTHMVVGSTWTEPPKTAHFAFAKDEDVVIQVVGVGPTGSLPVAK